MKRIFFLLLVLITFNFAANSQCVTSEIDLTSNPNVVYDANNDTYNIDCTSGSVTISSNTFDSAAINPSEIQWTNGEIGDFTFTPDCNNPGCFDFTPCVPALTIIPLHCATFASLNVPTSGSVPAGGSTSFSFTISDFCFASGANYDGEIGISLGGSGAIDLAIIQPDGTSVGPLTFDITLINLLSPINLGILGFTSQPNGDWQIIITDAGAGSFTYNVDPTSEICVAPYATSNISCGEPITVCVAAGCPSFVDATANKTEICSGEDVNFSAIFNPQNNNDIIYFWSGNGFDVSNESLPNPSINLTNNTCDPITETYFLTASCVSDGSNLVDNFPITITVYPEIDLANIVADNTSNILEPDCSIVVEYPNCPNFVINGNSNFTAGDNGTLANFTISNGNVNCEQNYSTTINCLNNCTPANVEITMSDCINNNFTLNANVIDLGTTISPTLTLSDGSSTAINALGNYTFGPFANNEIINIKIVDSADPLCNVNLGNYRKSCNDCSNLLSINALNNNYCEDDLINLSAIIDQGTIGIDYSIQWFANSLAIAGANNLNFSYLAKSNNRCSNFDVIFTAKLTCLNEGNESTTDELVSNMISIFPVPVLGLDFHFDNCSVTPIENCNGSLVVNTDITNDSTINYPVTVNYSASLFNAPQSCTSNGQINVDCSDCVDYPGNGQVNNNNLCYGETVEFTNTNALVSSPGYQVGYAITTQHPSNYATTTDLINASIISPEGPFNAPGNITNASITNDGSLLNATSNCGQLIYATPFLSFNCTNYQALNEQGIIFTDAPGSITEPGIGGTSFAIPDVPFCAGLSSYDINLCVEDLTTDTFDPLSSSAFLGLVDNLPGGIYSNFPNLDDLHDSYDEGFFGGDPQCYAQNNWTGNPSGELISITTQNVYNVLFFGNGIDELAYEIIVNVDCGNVQPFPNPCDDCDVIGNTVVVNLLPNVSLTSIPNIPSKCEGESLDLTVYNPTANISGNGSFIWTDETGSPFSISDPTNVSTIVGANTFCVAYQFCNANNCASNKVCTTVNVYPEVSINPLPNQNICQGETVDLTNFENSIAGNGSIIWSIGSDILNNGAVISNPSNVIPIGSELYCANYTDNLTNCGATICFNFNYNDQTILPSPTIDECIGNDIELTDYNNQISNTAGIFVWYDSNPTNGAIPLSNTFYPNWNSNTDGTVFFVTFTNLNGCASTTQIEITDANCCPIFIEHNEPFVPTQALYKAEIYIQSDVTIQNLEAVEYNAGDYILLNIGFEVEQNADFIAEIEDCN